MQVSYWYKSTNTDAVQQQTEALSSLIGQARPPTEPEIAQVNSIYLLY